MIFFVLRKNTIYCWPLSKGLKKTLNDLFIKNDLPKKKKRKNKKNKNAARVCLQAPTNPELTHNTLEK